MVGPPTLPFPAEHPGIFLAIFFGIMIVTSYGTAALSGWRALARAYPSEGPLVNARVWRGVSVGMRNATRYNRGVNIAANHQGIELRVFFLLRLGHPPLFIPWSDIDTAPDRGWFIDYVRFSFRRAAPWMLLRSDLAKAVLATRGVR
jgi:hypothetical protein